MDDDGMTYEEFMAQPVPVHTDPESVARAVRYMEAWLPIGRASIGSATEHSMQILMQFAQEQTKEVARLRAIESAAESWATSEHASGGERLVAEYIRQGRG